MGKDETQVTALSGVGMQLRRVDVLLIVVLLVAIVGSALSVSFVAQKNRHMFNSLELLRKENMALHARWSRLLLERSTLASNIRIESVARKQLQLRPATPHDTVVIK